MGGGGSGHGWRLSEQGRRSTEWPRVQRWVSSRHLPAQPLRPHTWLSAHSAGTSSSGSCMQLQQRLRSWPRQASSSATPPGSASVVRRSDARRGKRPCRRRTAGGGSAHGLSASPRPDSRAGDSESSRRSRHQPEPADGCAAAASCPSTSRAKKEAARGATRSSRHSLAAAQARRCAGVAHCATCGAGKAGEGGRERCARRQPRPPPPSGSAAQPGTIYEMTETLTTLPPLTISDASTRSSCHRSAASGEKSTSRQRLQASAAEGLRVGWVAQIKHTQRSGLWRRPWL